METTLPKGFAEHLQALQSIDITALIQALDTPPAISVRLNRRKPSATLPYPSDGTVAWCHDGIYLHERPRFTFNPLLHAGTFYVQDASSMIHQTVASILIGKLRPMRGALRILDLCAAPGGKTTAIINAMADDDVIVANEYVGQRAAVLGENIAKWGFHGAAVTNADASSFASSGALFDIVAVDAPCSGEGMMRKEEMARSQWSPGLVGQCARLQRDIVASAVKALRPGGYLIYSTCTFNREENEENAIYFAETYGLSPVDLRLPPEWGIAPSCDGSLHALRFMPHVTRGEGLFLCVLQKPEADYDEPAPCRRQKEKKTRAGAKSVTNLPQWQEWVGNPDRYIAVADSGRLNLVPENLHRLMSALSGVRTISAGIEAAAIKGRDWTPLSTLALSADFRRDAIPVAEIDLDTALSYLRHEALTLPASSPKGMVAVAFKGHPLGMVKNLGNRANNLYPSQWRIRSNA